MPIFGFCIASDIDAPAPRQGYVRGDSAADALRRVRHRDANVYPMPPDFDWPGATASADLVEYTAPTVVIDQPISPPKIR